MIRILKCGEIPREKILLRAAHENDEAIERTVADILADVRENGDDAVLRYCEKFDGARPEMLEVTEAEIERAYESQDPDFIKTLEMARDNIAAFHSRQIRHDFCVNEKDGVVLGQKVMPIENVGIYVPGGTASYPSTVLMNTVPAALAGVPNIMMTSPPNRDGEIAPAILAAAKVAGVHRIFKMGGAQAVAAFAYGTESVPKADKIVGPGNIFVATAKRRVFGLVDIDMIAGPSEILVLADRTANPRHVVADLLSQAEHDKMATAVLVCDSEPLASAVAAELERQLAELPREEIARASMENNGKLIVAENMDEAVEIANAIAPEHLELSVDEPFAYLSRIKNAGSIFLGKNVPEALGDYFAGPNHTLPTSGTARFSSPLSVDDFVKRSSFIYYTREALGEVKDRVADFAHREGLDAHARSILTRFED